ncbi:MAG: hypothetical protein ACFE7E_06550 [Candidatus Hodarchaeota archaeon]
MSCPICGGASIGREGFCVDHKSTHKNLLAAFDDWRKALDITWEKYLKRISENDNAGIWAKEVAEYLSKNNKKSD